MGKISIKDCRSEGKDITRAAPKFKLTHYDVKEDPTPLAKNIYTPKELR